MEATDKGSDRYGHAIPLLAFDHQFELCRIYRDFHDASPVDRRSSGQSGDLVDQISHRGSAVRDHYLVDAAVAVFLDRCCERDTYLFGRRIRPDGSA